MDRKTRMQRLPLLSTIALSAAILLNMATALAQAAARPLSLEAGPLAPSLRALAREFKVNVLFADSAVAPHESPAVEGDFTFDEAMDRVLAGSGLEVKASGSRSFVVAEAAVLDEETPKPPKDNDEAAARPPVEIERIVVTASRQPTPITQVARSVSVINQTQLDTQLARTSNVGDLLGVLVPGFGAPNQTDLLRGFTLRGRNPQYLIDGVPLQFNGGVAVNESPLTKFDPQSLGRIEVLYGPTALYGAGAPGGVIQFFTREASPEPFELELRQQFSFHPDADEPFDNESHSWKTTASISGTLDRFDYFTLLSYDSQNALMDDDGDIVQTFSFQDELTFFAKLGYNIDENQRLQLTFNRIDTEDDGRIYDFQFGDDGFVFGTLSDNQRPFQWSEDREPVDEKRFLSLIYTHDDLFGGAFSALYYDRDEEIIGGLADRRNAGFPIGDQKAQSDVGDGWRLQYGRDFGASFSVMLGVDYDDQQRRADGELFFLGADFDATRDLTQPPAAVGFFNFPADVQTLGTFAQAEYVVNDRLRFSGGFRYEDVEFDVIGGSTFGDAFISSVFGLPLTVRPDVSGEASNTAYNLGANFVANDYLTLFGNFAQGLELNDVRRIPQLIPLGEEIEGSRFIEPQRVDNYEIGLRGGYGDIGYSFAAYRSESEFGQTFFFDPDEVLGGTALAPKRIEGFETTFEWFINDDFDLLATYSWSEGDVDIEGDDRGFVAISTLEVQPWKATLVANYAVNENIALNFQALVVGDRDKAFDEGIDPFRIEGYHVLDMGARFELPVGTFDVQLTNLLNDDYLTAASQTQLGIPAFADRVSPSRGRNVSLVYTVRF